MSIFISAGTAGGKLNVAVFVSCDTCLLVVNKISLFMGVLSRDC